MICFISVSSCIHTDFNTNVYGSVILSSVEWLSCSEIRFLRLPYNHVTVERVRTFGEILAEGVIHLVQKHDVERFISSNLGGIPKTIEKKTNVAEITTVLGNTIVGERRNSESFSAKAPPLPWNSFPSENMRAIARGHAMRRNNNTSLHCALSDLHTR